MLREPTLLCPSSASSCPTGSRDTYYSLPYSISKKKHERVKQKKPLIYVIQIARAGHSSPSLYSSLSWMAHHPSTSWAQPIAGPTTASQLARHPAIGERLAREGP
ncbi:hypothetical protein GGI43DRAFT_22067 [Trichoderma evansii]